MWHLYQSQQDFARHVMVQPRHNYHETDGQVWAKELRVSVYSPGLTGLIRTEFSWASLKLRSPYLVPLHQSLVLFPQSFDPSVQLCVLLLLGLEIHRWRLAHREGEEQHSNERRRSRPACPTRHKHPQKMDRCVSMSPFCTHTSPFDLNTWMSNLSERSRVQPTSVNNTFYQSLQSLSLTMAASHASSYTGGWLLVRPVTRQMKMMMMVQEPSISSRSVFLFFTSPGYALHKVCSEEADTISWVLTFNLMLFTHEHEWETPRVWKPSVVQYRDSADSPLVSI